MSPPELVEKGLRHTGSENYGGPIVTAGGLVFIGATNNDKKLRALDKASGELLWHHRRRRQEQRHRGRRFNEDTGSAILDEVLKAGLAHLWFVTIHPFDDGNGRVARAIADLTLARSEHSSQRFYSMSAQIRQERNEYYEILERTQKGTLDVTLWMEWFLACLGRVIDGAQTTLAAVLQKARFWQAVRDVPIGERQRLILNRLLDGFEGNLTTSKWATIAKCSSDTALRDIADLVERGVLVRNAGAGRSTNYSLANDR